MKKLMVINGAMGVGKTSVCKEINKKLVNSAWLDGDWCIMTNPLNYTGQNQKMFLDNVYYLLNNYLSNSSIDHIIFSWVIPREEMIGYLTKRLSAHSFEVFRVTLLCEVSVLRRRMLDAGRDEATIEKSMLLQQLFRSIDTVQIDTTSLSVMETSDKILAIWNCD